MSGGRPDRAAELACLLDLYFEVDQTLQSLGGERLLRVARSVGLRRQANMLRTLHREKQRLVMEIETIGACPVSRPPPSPAKCLQASFGSPGFMALAASFMTCAAASRQQGKEDLTKWLHAHAHGHRLNARYWSTGLSDAFLPASQMQWRRSGADEQDV